MASLQQRHWSGEVAGPSRRDRRPCAYEVYLPDRLQGRRFSLDGDVAAEVTRTETALIRLDATGNALANSEALARLLLRAESVASSRIEGLEIGGRRLLRADVAQRLGMEPRDVNSTGGPGQHRCDDVGGGLGEARWRHHPGVPAGDSSTAAGRNTSQGPRRQRPSGAELDRRQRLQSLLGVVRTAAAGGRARAAGRPLGVLQRGLASRTGAGCGRPCAVRDHPPIRGRQRARRTCVGPHGAAQAWAGTADTAAGLPHPGDMVTGLHRRPERDTPRRPIQLRRGARRHQQLDRALRLCVQPVGGGCRSFRGPGARAAVRLAGDGWGASAETRRSVF